MSRNQPSKKVRNIKRANSFWNGITSNLIICFWRSYFVHRIFVYHDVFRFTSAVACCTSYFRKDLVDSVVAFV